MTWKDTKVTQIFPQREQKESSTDLSKSKTKVCYRTNIRGQIIAKPTLQTALSVLRACKPRGWKSCLISQFEKVDVDQHWFKVLKPFKVKCNIVFTFFRS